MVVYLNIARSTELFTKACTLKLFVMKQYVCNFGFVLNMSQQYFLIHKEQFALSWFPRGVLRKSFSFFYHTNPGRSMQSILFKDISAKLLVRGLHKSIFVKPVLRVCSRVGCASCSGGKSARAPITAHCGRTCAPSGGSWGYRSPTETRCMKRSRGSSTATGSTPSSTSLSIRYKPANKVVPASLFLSHYNDSLYISTSLGTSVFILV